MLRLSEYIYYFMPAVLILAIISSIVLRFINKKKVRYGIYSCLCLILIWGIAIATIISKTNLYTSSEIEFGMTKDEILQLMGSPYNRYEPAMGLDGRSDPRSAIWWYFIHVEPFKFSKSIEFRDNKVIGHGELYPKLITFNTFDK